MTCVGSLVGINDIVLEKGLANLFNLSFEGELCVLIGFLTLSVPTF